MEKPYSVHLSREFYRWKTTPQDPTIEDNVVQTSADVENVWA
jgi:hypothetical protein